MLSIKYIKVINNTYHKIQHSTDADKNKIRNRLPSTNHSQFTHNGVGGGGGGGEGGQENLRILKYAQPIFHMCKLSFNT